MNELNHWDLGIACIVLIGYISGKLWMYYRIDKEPNKSKRIKSGRKSRVIKRGPEWPNP